MSTCPYCGAQGGGQASCGSCQHHLSGSSVNSGRTTQNSGGGGKTDCFPGDAMVLTPRCQLRLDSLNKGDIVLGVDETGDIAPVTIKRKVSHSAHPILRVVSNNAELSFFVTKRHPIQTHRGWVRVKDLIAGDVLLHVSPEGKFIEHTVLRVDQTERYEPVYNLVVDGDHTYIVHGCIAHSFVYFRKLRIWLNRIFRKRGNRASQAQTTLT